jgi:hypothetical protein
MEQTRWFVYCYLRTHSNRPYYIGIGSRADRMTSRHSCKVPRDRGRIRVMRTGLTKQQAIDWEMFYIARYGRKDLGTGCLVNRTAGGESAQHSPLTLEKIRQAAKRPENIARLKTINVGRPMHPNTRAALLAATKGKKRPQHVIDAVTRAHKGKKKSPEHIAKQVETRERNTAQKLGLSYEKWAAMGSKERNALRMWVVNNPGSTGEDYLSGLRRRHGTKPRIDAEEAKRLAGLKWSQVRIAEALGCSPSCVSRILRGKRQRKGLYWE